MARFKKTPQREKGRDSSVGIATRYGLDGPGIESPWGGARFPAPVQTGAGVHPASCTTGTVYFVAVKRQGRGVDHPPHLSPRLKKEYSYTSTPTMGFSWPVLGLYLPLPLPQHEISLKFLESVSGCSMCAEGRAGMSKSTVTLGNVANAPDKCPRGICL